MCEPFVLLQTVRTFLNGMNKRGRGHIVAISSILGLEAQGHAICYCCTKFGVRGMMDALTEELRWTSSPVRTTTVYPSFVRTRKEFTDAMDMLRYTRTGPILIFKVNLFDGQCFVHLQWEI